MTLEAIGRRPLHLPRGRPEMEEFPDLGTRVPPVRDRRPAQVSCKNVFPNSVLNEVWPTAAPEPLGESDLSA